MSDPILLYGQKSEFGEFSNFYLTRILLDGKEWPSSEHYYMAQKTSDESAQEAIRQASTPAEAKRMGREVNLHDDWDVLKYDVMHRVVYAKFDQNEHLRFVLLSTGDRPIHESCRDPWWGGGPQFPSGRDWLGKVLMTVRDELRNKYGDVPGGDDLADLVGSITDPVSDLLRFYEGSGTDGSGRTLADVQAFSDGQMEQVHDWVQWVFPLPEPSRAQPHTPVASESDLQAFRDRIDLREQVLLSLGRWSNFLSTTQAWRGPLDHNHLRITRIIRFLTLIDMPDAANDLFGYAKDKSNVGDQTLWYWGHARDKDPVWLYQSWRP